MGTEWGAMAVYFPARESPSVRMAFLERYPPGTEVWGFNVSRWREGFHYVIGQSGIDLLPIVREAVAHPNEVEAVPLTESADEEDRARTRNSLGHDDGVP